MKGLSLYSECFRETYKATDSIASPVDVKQAMDFFHGLDNAKMVHTRFN